MADTPIFIEQTNFPKQITSLLFSPGGPPTHIPDPPPGVVFFVQGNSNAIRGEGGVGVWGNGVTGVQGNGEFCGIYGVALNGDAIGVYGIGGLWAGQFDGDVLINGNLIVQPSASAGSYIAIVPHPDESNPRHLYCLASPESWFEDFGEQHLTNGRKTVKLDPNFASLLPIPVDPKSPVSYHVFLTPLGDSLGLYVERETQTATEFTVREHHPGTSNVAFSFRVVGKRKDITAARFAKAAAKVPARAESSALNSPGPKRRVSPKPKKTVKAS